MSMTLLAYSLTAEARNRERTGQARPEGPDLQVPAAPSSPAELSEQFVASARKVAWSERLLNAALASCPPAMLIIAFTDLV